MYETYYGFTEKPFSLTPDPKYLYRSQSHADAFDLLQYAVTRREGFVVVTGDIGTGKTTLCRALLEKIDRATFTALVLNPFLSEEDLLKRILQDFGVISRADAKSGRLTGVSKQELIDALYDFLLGLIPLKASAVLIIDEAQNLPLGVLEQIRILSNLETDKEKLLQIILVGQLELQALLRSPQLRQLDQRVSIRYELQPLDREASAAYVSHRLAVAGGSAAVSFAPKALDRVHQLSSGIPRLINLLCDRALLAAFSLRTNRVQPEMVEHAARSLDVQPVIVSRRRSPSRFRSLRHGRVSLAAAGAGVLLSSLLGVGLTAVVYQRITAPVEARALASRPSPPVVPTADLLRARTLPTNAAFTIALGSYPVIRDGLPQDVRALTAWLESEGLPVYYAELDRGVNGRWYQVMAGSYTDDQSAARDLERLKAAAPAIDAHVIATTTDTEQP